MGIIGLCAISWEGTTVQTKCLWQLVTFAASQFFFFLLLQMSCPDWGIDRYPDWQWRKSYCRGKHTRGIWKCWGKKHKLSTQGTQIRNAVECNLTELANEEVSLGFGLGWVVVITIKSYFYSTQSSVFFVHKKVANYKMLVATSPRWHTVEY